MRILPRDAILIPENRQRRIVPRSHVLDLENSILSIGLLHPPVVFQRPGDREAVLVAGFCRLSAIDSLASKNLWFYCDGRMVVSGEVPVLDLHETLSPAQLKEAEFSENVSRLELPWQDRTAALAEIHNLRVAANPSQTVAETARELEADGGLGDLKTKRTFDRFIGEALVVAPHLSDPSIAKARNATEALHLVYAKEEKAYAAELIKRQPQATTSECAVRHGDALDLLPNLEASFVDLILTDPPYGISADQGGFRSRTIHHHNYEDSPDVAKALLQIIFTEGFRICRPRANLITFIDIDLFPWAKEVAKRSGWDVFRTPITWQKSDSEGLAPWGRAGFRRCCEWLLFATKGERGLYHPPLDVLRFNRVARDEREYGPEKPGPLLEVLIDASTLRGDMVLDPCCGSGSTLVAARRLGRKSLGIEKDESAFNLALVNSQKDLDAVDETPERNL